MDNIFKQSQTSSATNAVALLGPVQLRARPWLDASGVQYAMVNAKGGGLKRITETRGFHNGDVFRLYLVDRKRKFMGDVDEPCVVGHGIDTHAHDRSPVMEENGQPRQMWIEFYKFPDGHLADFRYTARGQTMCNTVTVDGFGDVNACLLEGAWFASPGEMLEHDATNKANASAAAESKRIRNDPMARQQQIARELAGAIQMAQAQRGGDESRREKGAR